MKPSVIAALCALAGTGSAQLVPISHQLVSDTVRVRFEEFQERLDLVSIENVTTSLPPIPFDPEAGGWEFVVRTVGGSAVPIVTACSNGEGAEVILNCGNAPFDAQPFCQAVRIDSTGLGTVGNNSLLLSVTGGGSQDWLKATWDGVFEDPGVPGQFYDFRVVVEWDVADGNPFVEGDVQVDIFQAQESSLYLSDVTFPVVKMQEIRQSLSDDCSLVVPLGEGVLVRSPSMYFNDIQDLQLEVPGILNLFGIFEETSTPGRCFFYSDNDWIGYTTDHRVGVEPSGTISFSSRHVPEDVFNALAYDMPFDVRLGALQGDWVQMADYYRGQLAQNAPNWYEGPVGTQGRPELESIVANVQYRTEFWSDNADETLRDMLRLTRILGEGVFTRWYEFGFPDRLHLNNCFDGGFFHLDPDGGLLPGFPSVPAAFREAQAQFGQVAAPYIPPHGAVFPPGSNPPTDGAQLLHETGQNVPIASIYYPSEFMCVGDTRWGPPAQPTQGLGAWGQATADWVLHTGGTGVYLDAPFNAQFCYAQDHTHAAGGGSWLVEDHLRMWQAVRDEVRDDLGRELLISGEFMQSRISEQIDIMLSPAIQKSILLDPTDGSMRPPGTVRTVPLFRMVHDDVKIGAIPKSWPVPQTRMSMATWYQAADALTYGHVPGVLLQSVDLAGSFFERRYAPYDRMLGRITRFLRDDFLEFHNGTVRRVPESFAVTTAHGLVQSTDYGHHVQTTQFQALTHAESYVEAPLTPGMYRSATGNRYAFVVANPIVDPETVGTLDMEFTATFDPATEPDFGSTSYQVTYVDDQGATTSWQASGPFDLGKDDTGANIVVSPGEIHHWILDPL